MNKSKKLCEVCEIPYTNSGVLDFTYSRNLMLLCELLYQNDIPVYTPQYGLGKKYKTFSDAVLGNLINDLELFPIQNKKTRELIKNYKDFKYV